MDDTSTWVDPIKDPKMFRITTFLARITNDVNLFDKYQTEKASLASSFFKSKRLPFIEVFPDFILIVTIIYN